MPVEVKICGLSTVETLDAAVAAGADYVGFVFFPRSPRNVSLEAAAALAARVPERVRKVALVVDADDAFLKTLLARVPLDLLQLCGQETPARTAAIRELTGRPVMKAIRIAEAADLDQVQGYLPVADRLLFDAKPPASMTEALPGGNALAFDWALLAGKNWSRPWMLAGALRPETVAEALGISGARAVDVSSGVESKPGLKDPEKIRAFLKAARGF